MTKLRKKKHPFNLCYLTRLCCSKSNSTTVILRVCLHELLAENEPSAISYAWVDVHIFWHAIPHPFQTSSLVFHYFLSRLLMFHPPAPVLDGLHALVLWSSSVELSSLIHFAQRHYLYSYISPAEGSQHSNVNIKDSLLDTDK